MLTLTDKARERVLSFIEQEDSPVALRVAVQSGSPLAPQYELMLVDASDEQPDDTVIDADGFKVYIDEGSAAKLEGATVDWVETMHGGGFQVENPNIKPIGAEAPTGELAERISQYIDSRINPAVASHGGRISLVDVRENTVFVRLSGGCQGCGMATVTLKQGVERMLREAFPTIEDVIDVTDHSMGTNPYYEAAR
ncbi:MAG: iron-sulfur cluster assembly accessory protein [Gemmatimonadetes bacterium]|uniref:Iron-sulfur cluster assembly accessory protein n=1 Tax=Candidatus Kutchimonas denitrificans TaxID=3056748 RepID=A0AAE5CB20_9BACT|nr:iron-sulfur cluster assembly accessory protein [Gemmatimonadota bacterium]NIR73998.1 iron-sulfur cluster assembly accessory protein [Candidatus Kutchimonas denitrificans]NIS02987.1 iron-sulfur cluster assembly accessory protein [Gemmatimonadota bacterium]NIT68704.1 iron-sulfur cluster assembly accessory protein [Gemmatimonadota bacterium]NIU53285.1 iron-sulfur cluster assembly accessory protein [Gemmatimonadota bacterium]